MKKIKDRLFGFLKKKIPLDVEYYAYNGAWLLFANLTIGFTGLLLMVLLTRYLSQSDFGKYSLFTSIIGVMIIFSLTGMFNTVWQLTAQGYKNVLEQSIKMRFKTSFLGSLALLIVAAYFFYRSDSIWFIYVIAAGMFPYLYSYDGVVPYLCGISDFRKVAVYKIISASIPSLLILLVLFFTRNVYYVILSFCLVNTLVYVLLFKSVSQKKPETKKALSERKKEELNKKILYYGKHFTIVSLISTIYNYVDKIITSYFLGYVALATYSVASMIPNELERESKVLYELLLSKFTKKQDLKINMILPYVFLIMAATAFCMYIISFFLPWVIQVFFTSKYLDSLPYMRILLISVVLWIPSLVLRTFLESKMQVKQLYIFNNVVAALGIIMYLVLVPFFGLEGLVIANVINQALTFIVLFILSVRLSGQKKPGRVRRDPDTPVDS
jgi:O-antigen/teichoic acid export membrane protein